MSKKPKRSSAKKSTKKKIPAKHSKSARHRIVQGIGIVTSIRIARTLQQAFLRGLNMPGLTPKFLPIPPSYDSVALNGAVTSFNADSSIGLIVTAGGLVSATAALVSAQKPWICLVGGAPGAFASIAGNFYGGVSLESYAHHRAHLDHQVNNHSINAADICLLHNPNSTMSGEEVRKWSLLAAAQPIAAGRDPATGKNNIGTYATAFNNIPANVKAVVVSADPFFQETMDDLIAAANAWIQGGVNRRISFPLQDYKNNGGGHPPRPQRHTLHGPNLEAAYELMGRKAATILASGRPSTLDKMAPGTPQDH